jgi:hypothetical protein
MLSNLDRIIFPDRCVVYEVVPSQRYVYPIFKNGSSSLYITPTRNRWKIKLNEQIKKINSIDVILRHPEERLLSGVNTFIKNTVNEHHGLDKATVSWFAQNYLYLNRHYCSQFIWLLNLARFLHADARLNFLSMDAIDSIVGQNKKPPNIEPPNDALAKQVAQIQNNEMYQRIDLAIFNCIGQSLTFAELLQHIKTTEPDAYEYVIGYAQQILKPTYALS